MSGWGVLLVVAIVIGVVLVVLALSIRVVQQFERGVQFRLGRLHGVREPGLRLIIPVVDRLRKVSLRTVTRMRVSKVRTGSSLHSTAKKRSLSL